MRQFAPKDRDIIRLLSQFGFLTQKHLLELTRRHPKMIWQRLRALGPDRKVWRGERKDETEPGLGYVNYVLEDSDELRSGIRRSTWEISRVYFLTQKGWNKALELGFIDHPVNATDEKSNQNIAHDLKMTEVHLALWRKYGERLHWFQYRPFIYHRWGTGEDDHINADAFFWLDLGDRFPAGFVELENNRESDYRDGDSKLIRKFLSYARFADGVFQSLPHFRDFNDFRVFTYRLSEPLAWNISEKAAHRDKSIATRRFWSASIPQVIKGEEKVYLTPKDYAQRRYSLDEA